MDADKFFERIRDIANTYLKLKYPEAPDPDLFMVEIEKTISKYWGPEEKGGRVSKCKKEIRKHLKERVDDFKKALDSFDKYDRYENEGSIYEDITEWLNSYAIACYDDPHYRAKRLELSYGGPQDYFLFFEDGTIKYKYLNWFDGAEVDLEGEDWNIMKRVYDAINV